MAKKKYTILGASGHIGGVVSERLLEAGHEVRVVARSTEHLKKLIQKGGIPSPAFFTDAGALSKTFENVDAVFTIIPPDMMGTDYRGFQKEVGEATTQALRNTGISHVVNLSSIGAHLPEKTGPILELYHQEKRLNQIDSLNVVHLRPAYFMENLFYMIDVMRSQGMAGSAIKADLKIPMIATQDIGTRAAELLLRLDFQGKSTMELLGERDLSMQEVTSILGRAIGKPDLPYVAFPYEGVEAAMKQMGIPVNTISMMIEMYRSYNDGFIQAEETRSNKNTTPTSIEEFSEIFAAVFSK